MDNSLTGQIDFAAVSQYETLFRTLGKSVLNALYPNDFEYYLTAFELVNSKDETIEYFVFPVNPSSMRDLQNFNTSVNVTAGGVVTHSRKGFNPTDVNLIGTFGRKFKFLVGDTFITFTGQNFKIGELKLKDFSPNIKTGYGCIKVMERIVKQAQELDDYGNPHSLFLYNLGSGTNYLVKCMSFEKSMDLNDNMLWKYNLGIKTLAIAETLQRRNKQSLVPALRFTSRVQKGVGSLVNNLLTTLNNNGN